MPMEGDILFTLHNDVPGIIGKVGTILGEMKVNIARMGVGRDAPGGKALMIVEVDGEIPKTVLDRLVSLKDFREARFIQLSKMKLKAYMMT
jgi:D-3-phosphoglycerate dehydrogenase